MCEHKHLKQKVITATSFDQLIDTTSEYNALVCKDCGKIIKMNYNGVTRRKLSAWGKRSIGHVYKRSNDVNVTGDAINGLQHPKDKICTITTHKRGY